VRDDDGVPAEPITLTAPREPGRTAFSQNLRDVAFLHWPVDPGEVAPMLPAGVRPDTLDGRTYVGLIAFRGRSAGVLGSPGLPYLGSFLEMNVRLYSVDGAGRRGVVFLSLDASRLLPVVLARGMVRLPYRWARMRAWATAGGWTYISRRRWPGPRGVTSRLVLRVGDQIRAPSELDRFLTARWGLHYSWRGRTYYWPNTHQEWPLHNAELVDLVADLVAADGVRVPAGPPVSVLWSPGVDVRFGFPRPLRRS
jgi:uncharacterized protein